MSLGNCEILLAGAETELSFTIQIWIALPKALQAAS